MIGVGGVTDNVPTAPSLSATYTVTGTDANGCSNTSTVSITVHALPTVGGNVTDSTICAGTVITFTGTGADNYSWTGGVVNATPFTPGGTATYTVTGTDVNSCSNTATVTVTVFNLPTVSFTISIDSVCTNWGSVTLPGATPPGGTYSGSGVTGNMFDPGVGTGNHVISYTYTDANGCSNVDTDNILVSGCLAIYNEPGEEVMIYPNPTESYFYIKSNTAEIYDLFIMDMNGKMMYNGKASDSDMIDISQLAPGAYIVELRNNDQLYRSTLIKK